MDNYLRGKQNEKDFISLSYLFYHFDGFFTNSLLGRLIAAVNGKTRQQRPIAAQVW